MFFFDLIKKFKEKRKVKKVSGNTSGEDIFSLFSEVFSATQNPKWYSSQSFEGNNIEIKLILSKNFVEGKEREIDVALQTVNNPDNSDLNFDYILHVNLPEKLTEGMRFKIPKDPNFNGDIYINVHIV